MIVGVELNVNSSYSELIHGCQSTELECIVSGLHEKAKEDANIHVVHYDSNGVLMYSYACEKPISMNRDTVICRTIISPCKETDSGIYVCTIKTGGKEFSSAIQDVKIESDNMEMIILGSSIGVLFLVAIFALNSASCIYIFCKRRKHPAPPPPPIQVVGGNDDGQLLPQAHNHARAQSPHAQRAPSPAPRRARSPIANHDQSDNEREPLLSEDEKGIAENQSKCCSIVICMD